MERRLAAVLAADVVGYSRLMREDETGTLDRLKSLRKELVQPTIRERKGRVVKLMGDGLLAEFPSVVEAVQCAVEIQQSMIRRETDLPDERRIRLRIGVNLGDIIVEGSDKHIWAERYDRHLIDIFELQDELTRAVVATLPGRIESAGVERIRRSQPRDMSVYDSLLRARLLHHRGTREDNAKALELLNDLIKIDPEFAPAYAWKACIIGQAWARGYLPQTEQTFFELLSEVEKGYSIDENDIECVRILCEYRIQVKQWDEARLFQDRAYKLNPNDSRILAQRGELLTWMGRPEEGLPWIEQAMRLNPYEADTFAHLLVRALFGLEQYEDSVSAFMRAPAGRYANQAYLSACFAHLAMPERAAARAANVVRLKKDFAAKAFVASLYHNEENDEARLREGLLKAGLPLE